MRILVATLFPLVVALGCGVPPDAGGFGNCQDDDDCVDGDRCVDLICVGDEGEGEGEEGEGEGEEGEGEGEEGEGEGDPELLGPCDTDADCDSTASCDLEAGRCRANCGCDKEHPCREHVCAACFDDSECPSNAACADGACVIGCGCAEGCVDHVCVGGEGEGEGEEGEGEGEEGEGEGEGEECDGVDGLDCGAYDVDVIVEALRQDRAGTFATLERSGFPVDLGTGLFLFVSFDDDRVRLAGDFNLFVPRQMNVERDGNGTFLFAWFVEDADAGDKYKFVDDGNGFFADPNARTYAFDDNGEISFVTRDGNDRGAYPRLYGRHFDLAFSTLRPRNVRVLIPAQPATHVLYTHDGQNVFRQDSSTASPPINGGWGLDEYAPDDMMVVAIDNTPERFDEYTHTTDSVGGGTSGGRADDYADLLQLVVRPLVDDVYGEAPVVGTMGSSLGGLVSFAIVDRYPDDYDFAAGLSSTFGWGSFNNPTPDDGDTTMIDVYGDAGHRGTALYLDSGGSDGSVDAVDDCEDADNDGIEDDDGEADDNYCETLQMRDLLVDKGYVEGVDLRYVFDPGPSGNGDAQHTEQAWRFRAEAFVLPFFDSL